MTAATLTREDAYAVASQAWDLYRHAQSLPLPAVGGGKFLAAQYRLFRAAEPYASGRRELAGADLGAIERAAADLDAIVSGTEAAA